MTPSIHRAKLACMQTLGLSGESKRSDGRLKGIFWPTVENAWDVDYLGQQGFWICVIVAGVQVFLGLVSGNPIMLVGSAATALVFLMGAMGVREANWPAAAMVFTLFSTDILYTLAAGRLPGVDHHLRRRPAVERARVLSSLAVETCRRRRGQAYAFQ